MKVKSPIETFSKLRLANLQWEEGEKVQQIYENEAICYPNVNLSPMGETLT